MYRRLLWSLLWSCLWKVSSEKSLQGRSKCRKTQNAIDIPDLVDDNKFQQMRKMSGSCLSAGCGSLPSISTPAAGVEHPRRNYWRDRIISCWHVFSSELTSMTAASASSNSPGNRRIRIRSPGSFTWLIGGFGYKTPNSCQSQAHSKANAGRNPCGAHRSKTFQGSQTPIRVMERRP